MDKYKNLLEEKLEWGELSTFVPNKKIPVYNWLYFKEGFSRDMVFNILDLFNSKGIILDPFCGSGTTLLASRERGLPSLGLDKLPIALLASRVKTSDFDPEELRGLSREIFSIPFEKLQHPCPYKVFFNSHVLDDILLFRREIFRIENPLSRDFFLLALASSAARISWMWKDGNVLKVSKHPVPPFRKFLKKSAIRMIKDLEKSSFPGSAQVRDSSPWVVPLLEGTADSVITSPPYLSQIDYSKIYGMENWLIGRESRIETYLGPEKEEKYFQDMEKVLQEAFRVLRKGGKAGLVVGNAYFPQEDRIVETDLALAAIGEKAGFSAKKILVLNKRFALQKRTIKKGVLRESLVILEKS